MKKKSVKLRPPRPGDMGRVVQLHGELYAREFGYDTTFEALVAEIAAGFVRDFQPKRERCWIAEMDGDVVGSIFSSESRRPCASCACSSSIPARAGRGSAGA